MNRRRIVAQWILNRLCTKLEQIGRIFVHTINPLAHEGFHRTEYLKNPTAWDKEAETERGLHDREVRAYKYHLDFYTRFNSMDPKRPNSDMSALQKLIDSPTPDQRKIRSIEDGEVRRKFVQGALNKMTIRAWFLTTIIFLVVVCMIANGQDRLATSSDPLSISIVADKACYRLRDKISITITIKNDGAVPIFLYRQKASNFLEGLETLLYDPHGKLLGQRNPRGVKIWLTPRPDDFLELSSGGQFRQRAVFTLSSRDAVTEGEYFVRALYRSPVSSLVIPSLMAEKKVWLLEDDNVYSPKQGISAISNCKI